MFRTLLLFLSLPVAAHAVDLPGTWSNGQDEFKTISLMLRSDGQAVLASAVMPSFARWEKTNSGLTLTLANDDRPIVIPFTYNATTDLLTGKFKDTDIVLRKVSDQEPPDMLAHAKERHAKEQAEIQKLWRRETRTLSGRKAVRALLRKWMAETNTAQRAESISFSTSDKQGYLTLRGINTTGFIDVPMESRHVVKPSGYPVSHKSFPADAVSALPVTYELSASRRDQLGKLAQEPGVQSETHTYGQHSYFGPEAFYRTTQFVVKSDAQPDLLTLAEKVMDILWETEPKSITATLHFRIPEAP
jgi:hypothetical protein